MALLARRRAALPPAFHALLEAAQLASEKQPFDPMDRALIALAAEHLPLAAAPPAANWCTNTASRPSARR